MKIISIVHCSLNSPDVEPVVTALISNVSPKFNHEVIIIENGTDISQADKIKSKFPQVIFGVSEKFIGVSQGLNMGIKFALDREADFIWLTDPFVIPMSDMFFQLSNAADTYKDCLIFTPKIFLNYNSKIIDSAGYTTDWTNLGFVPRGHNESDQPVFDRDLEVDYVPVNQMMIRSKAWSEVGLFDTRYFTHFYDLDFSTKIRSHGYHLNYISLAHAYRLPGNINYPTSAETYYNLRDKVYFSLLRAPPSTKIANLKLAYDKYFHGDPWEKRAIMDTFTGRLGSGSYQWE